MSDDTEIGELSKSSGEVRFEWEVPNFFTLPEERGKYYRSPVFYFSDGCWCFNLYPHGQADTPEWIGLFLARLDSGPLKHFRYSLGIKTSEKEEKILADATTNKICKKTSYGLPEFLLREELVNQKSKFAPSDKLTVVCLFRKASAHLTGSSLISRLWNLSRDMKAVIEDEKNTDFVLKVQNKELKAHKVILEARCDYFAGMLRHELQENLTGEGKIDDIEADTLKKILSYLYCGEIELYDNDVCKVYVAADKLLLKELKEQCAVHMKERLNEVLVCNVLELCRRYEGEENLRDCAMNYFIQNTYRVIRSNAWKKFRKENTDLAFELLENFVVKKS